MTSPFRRTFPPSGVLTFDGGKNSKFERSIIEDNESPDCLNVVFTNGAVETRQGSTKLNTAAIGTFVGDGLYTRHDRSGSETMVACGGGTVWQLGTTSFTTIPSAQSVFTAGVRFAAVENENYLFLSNGGTIPYKWNGAEFTRHGVYPPTTTSTVASQAAGGLTGDYQYKVTNVNSNLVESDVGPVTATFTAAGATLRVSLQTFAASYGVNSRRLYRTVAGGTTFKRVATISDNTTTTYDDNVADGSLGTTAPTDNGVPPKYDACIYHATRLFVNDTTNRNYVWYSNLGDPYTFPTTNFFKVGDNTDDLVRGFGIHDGSLLIFCDKSVYIVAMSDTTPGNWSAPQKTRSPYGSKSPYAILNVNNKVLFPALEGDKFVGFGAMAGSAIDPSASLLTVSVAGSDLQSQPIEPDMFLVQDTYAGNISGIVYKNKAYLTLTYDSGNTTNNRVYVMDFSMSNLRKRQKISWVPWTGLNAAQMTIYGGNLYYISSTATGFVYKLEAGVYSDDGSAINSYYWTKEYAGRPGEENFHKDFRYANFLIGNEGDWFMNMGYRTDSDKGGANVTQVDLDPGSSLWGTMVWGRDSWGGGSDQRDYRLYLGSARGKRIQFYFSNQNTAGQKFKVHWGTFHYNVKGLR